MTTLVYLHLIGSVVLIVNKILRDNYLTLGNIVLALVFGFMVYIMLGLCLAGFLADITIFKGKDQ